LPTRIAPPVEGEWLQMLMASSGVRVPDERGFTRQRRPTERAWNRSYATFPVAVRRQWLNFSVRSDLGCSC